LQGNEVNGLNIDLTNIPKVAHNSVKEQNLPNEKSTIFSQNTLEQKPVFKNQSSVQSKPSSSNGGIRSKMTDSNPIVEKEIKSKMSDSDIKTNSNVESEQKTTKTVSFLSAVPKFVGKQLEIYGPFNQGDNATLPSDVADVLINKGRAQEVN
jgi:hypothetical protein